MLSGSSRSNRVAPAMRARLFAFEPVVTPCSYMAAAASRTGIESTSSSRVTSDPLAISSAWPARPNPVTSVTALTSYRCSTSAADLFSVASQSMQASIAAGGTRSLRLALKRTPLPIGLLRMSRSPGRAPLLRQYRSGCTTPVTASPNLGSSSSIVWPPARTASASVILLRAPSTIPWSTSGPSSAIGKQIRFKHVSGRPPMAYTSLIELAAPICPYRNGSSTGGVMMSAVTTSAISSLRRYTPASSLVSKPTSRFGSALVGRAASSLSSPTGLTFAAHPQVLANPVSVFFFANSAIVTGSVIVFCKSPQASARGHRCQRANIGCRRRAHKSGRSGCGAGVIQECTAI